MTRRKASEAALARIRASIVTLVCANCNRPKWMHEGRHEPCPSFCWVTADTVTDGQIQELRFMRGAAHDSHDVSIACARALNEFGGHPADVVREARRKCAVAINKALNGQAGP